MKCESCDVEIKGTDPVHHTNDGCYLCEKCAPTFGDQLETSRRVLDGAFEGVIDPMLALEITIGIADHLIGGGELTDKVIHFNSHS